MFYDEYSTETFTTIVNKYLDAEFVQPVAAQIEEEGIERQTDEPKK